MLDILYNLVYDYTLRSVAAGSAVLGIVSGALGAFAMLRRQSLMGDAISHTALPGVALAFLITGSRSPISLMIGAGLAGWLGTLAVMSIIRRSRIKQDSALGMVLAVFFGFGLVLMTFVQRSPQASKAGLDTFLFGQASAMMTEDIYTMAIAGSAALALLTIFWKEIKLLSFDQEFGVSMGIPMRAVDILFTTLLVVAIVIGLQTVGVILMSAMVVAPAAAARQWTDRLGLMVLLSALFGAGAGVTGATISSLTSRLPTGPTIVLSISAIVLVSLLFAPHRGLVYNWLRSLGFKRTLSVDTVLIDLYELAEQHHSWEHPHSPDALRSMSARPEAVAGTLDELRKRSLAEETAGGLWHLTEAGRSQAEQRLARLGNHS